MTAVFGVVFRLRIYYFLLTFIVTQKKYPRAPAKTPHRPFGAVVPGRVTDSWPEARLIGIVEPITFPLPDPALEWKHDRVSFVFAFACFPFAARVISTGTACLPVTLTNTTVVPFIMSTRRICTPYFTTFAYRRQRLRSQRRRPRTIPEGKTDQSFDGRVWRTGLISMPRTRRWWWWW